MKLNIDQEQKEITEGCFGSKSILYILNIRLDVSPSEMESIKKQKLDEKFIAQFPAEGIERKVWIGDILNKNTSYIFHSISLLQQIEQQVIERCKSLKQTIEADANFGGSKSIDL
jgi:hypothetical protein